MSLFGFSDGDRCSCCSVFVLVSQSFPCAFHGVAHVLCPCSLCLVCYLTAEIAAICDDGQVSVQAVYARKGGFLVIVLVLASTDAILTLFLG